ncbi:PEP-CTERM sorting domain-containing protein [Adhaeretor mobilis]|uniref:Ice-binding protein C-terminal domain-containing protein n=1 Tax=Adhaeretor mobilis TaxID=1930276 RepID=A0A517MWD1_9BACT|nr:PEP-CTERM sorting domain-containing protein [Adhaeretor mobilis]QDS99178.1 hypothetical protein HG15A2_24700 [Adhaeretor mobilis]
MKQHYLALVVVTTMASTAYSQVNVWLDFNTDWVTEINKATSDAGQPNFGAIERNTIQNNILSQVQSIYSGYNISFSLTDPGGVRDRVNFGTPVSGPGAGVGVLGFAPLQVGNFSTGDEINMVPQNFAFFIDPSDGDPNDVGITRPEQIAQISRGFSGTVGHELGHSLGLNHHQAYGDPGIIPANYLNTGGLQNQHIIATGDTGLDENEDLGRESVRGFNRWERATLDITGGFTSTPGLAGLSLVNSPIAEVAEAGDAGDTFAGATPITFATGESSGMELSLRTGDLDDVTNDIDFYSFTVGSAGSLMAEVFSVNLEADQWNSFDSLLTLYDTDGTTVLATSDDLFYQNNNFLSGSTTALSFDPFLVNIPLSTAGTYYLGLNGVADNQVGDQYALLTGFVAIPEPTSLLLIAVGATAMLARSRRFGSYA